MLAMAKVGSVIGKYQPVLEEVELNQRRNDARMERILISTTSLAWNLKWGFLLNKGVDKNLVLLLRNVSWKSTNRILRIRHRAQFLRSKLHFRGNWAWRVTFWRICQIVQKVRHRLDRQLTYRRLQLEHAIWSDLKKVQWSSTYTLPQNIPFLAKIMISKGI